MQVLKAAGKFVYYHAFITHSSDFCVVKATITHHVRLGLVALMDFHYWNNMMFSFLNRTSLI